MHGTNMKIVTNDFIFNFAIRYPEPSFRTNN